MNYQKHYDNLIQSRKKACSFGNLEYWEKHHIVPKCLGGSNDEFNLVLLTAREHYIAHWLLTKIYKENINLIRAFFRMNGHKDKRRLSSKQFERLKNLPLKHTEEAKRKIAYASKNISKETRKKLSKASKKMWKDKDYRERMLYILRNPSEETLEKRKTQYQNIPEEIKKEAIRKIIEANKGRKKSEEEIEKIVSKNRGRKNSEESKRKMSESAKNRPPISEETRRKMSESRKKNITDEYKKNLSERMKGNQYTKGKVHSEETKQKMSESHKKDNKKKAI